MNEPVLGKHPDDSRRDYKPMTWERFLLLRAWAKYAAWHQGCTVAMVGSVLEKDLPRDIDIACIWPTAEFEKMFGPIPTDQESHDRLWQGRPYDDKRVSLWISANRAVGFVTRIDVRVCPDCWWPDKDRLVLATPSENAPPDRWGDVEFGIYRVVRAGDPDWQSN